MRILISDIDTVRQSEGILSIEKTSVCIEGQHILSVGSQPEGFVPDKIIRGQNKLLMPGLINAHTHSYMTLFRNYADDLPFHNWLFDHILPLEDRLTAEDCYWGSLLAIMEMIRTGTTCFFDMVMFIHETANAVAESGIRACLSRGLVGEGSDAGGQRRLTEAKDEINRWQGNSDTLLRFMFSAHAPYTCDPKFLEIVIAEAKAHGMGLCIHLAESWKEVETIHEKYGVTPTEYLNQIGFFDEHTLAAHCIYLTESDLDVLAAKKVSVVTNPVSNLKLGNGFAPLKGMKERHINVCLGTDSAASNNTQNLFKDLQFVTLIHKGVNEDAEMISAEEGFKMATVNGAKALGMDRHVGRIEVGMKADLVIMDMDQPHFYPKNNLISALAYSASGYEVETVMVNGKILYENNEFKTIDAEKVRYHIERISKRLVL